MWPEAPRSGVPGADIMAVPVSPRIVQKVAYKNQEPWQVRAVSIVVSYMRTSIVPTCIVVQLLIAVPAFSFMLPLRQAIGLSLYAYAHERTHAQRANTHRIFVLARQTQ